MTLRTHKVDASLSTKTNKTSSQSNSDGSVNRAIRVRLATSILYGTLMKNCFKDWSQYSFVLNGVSSLNNRCIVIMAIFACFLYFSIPFHSFFMYKAIH